MFEHVRKTVLIVLFIPSVERDGRTGIDRRFEISSVARRRSRRRKESGAMTSAAASSSTTNP